jgi:ketosteroid isomerase-like protein
MSESANIEVTQNLFSAFGAGDIPAILELLNDDIVIEFYGPDVIPYAGMYHGKAQAREFFATVLSSVDINQFDAEEIIADGDKVIVTGHLNLNAKTTGRTIDSDFVHVITLANGKWTRFRDFMQTAVAVQAFA